MQIKESDLNFRMFRGFVKLKKIREKLGSGWVGQAPTRIFFFEISCFLCCFHDSKCFQKELKIG